MATIQDLRKAHPEYKDLSDKELADGIYQKYYSDIPRDDFYKKISFTPPPETPFLEEAGKTVMEGLPGRFGVRVAQGAMGVPGFPVDAMVAGGNFMRRQFDLPEVQSVPGTPAHDWGSEGWRKYFEQFVGKPNIPDATSEAERVTDKAGLFVGGGLPFGPAGLLPSATATAGSEIGRATDKAGLTGGYGEFGGAVLGGMAPGLVRGQATSGIANAPSIAALQAAKRAAYNASEAEGAIFTPQAMDRLNNQVKQHASDFGYDPANQPGIAPVLKRLEEASTQNVTLKGLDTIRKVAGHAAGDFTKPSQQTLASKIKEFIDALPDNLQPGDVLAGDATKAADLINKGRYLNQRISLAKTLDEAMANAKLQAGSSGVGGNLENAMRQKIKAILTSPKRRAGFSPAERKLMEQIVTGNEGMARNALRHVGGFAPSKGFLPAALNVVAGTGGSIASGGALTPLALATMGGLEGAKALGEALTRRDIARLNAMVRMGRQGGQTVQQKTNAAWLEAQRRARLARQSTLPVLPGAVEQDR